MSDRLDEAALRRPDWLGGVPVTLADGQEWTLPRAATYFEPDADDDAEVRQRWNLGEEYGALVQRLAEAQRPSDHVRAEIALARWLLTRNYALNRAQLVTLLRFGYGASADDGPRRLREEVMAVALGDAPRPKACGDGLA